MDIPILNVIEPETSMEPDEDEAIYTRAAANNATKSLFNITFDNLPEQKHESVEFKDYETHLKNEIKDWKSFLHKAHQDVKRSKEKHPIVDKSILPPEKRKYLEEAPDLQSFIRESIEFRQKAHVFLELDYPQFMEMVENLEGLCERHLDLIKKNKICEILANVTK